MKLTKTFLMGLIAAANIGCYSISHEFTNDEQINHSLNNMSDDICQILEIQENIILELEEYKGNIKQ